MHGHRTKLTFTRVCAFQNGAAGDVCACAYEIVIALALCDRCLASIAVHSCQSHRQVLKQNLHGTRTCDETALGEQHPALAVSVLKRVRTDQNS